MSNVKVIEKKIEINKSNLDLCCKLIDEKKYVEVKKICNNILSSKNCNNSICFLAIAEWELKNYLESIKLLNSILLREYRVVEPYYDFMIYNSVGLVCLGNNKFDYAIKFFKIAIKLNSNNYLGLKRLAEAYKFKGDLDNSLKYYLQAYNINMLDSDLLAELGGIYHSMSEYKRAKKFLNKSLIIDSKNIKSLAILAKIYSDFNKLEESLRVYKKILAIDKKKYHFYNDIFLVYFDLGYHKKSKIYLDKFLEYYPENASAYNNLGMYCSYYGDLNNAIIFYKKAINLLISKTFRIRAKKAVSWDGNKLVNNLFFDLYDLCKQGGVKIFLSFGTLLGCIREGGVISYDKDFDFGLFEDDYQLFKKLILKSSKFKIVALTNQDVTKYSIAVRHVSNLSVDIFLYSQDRNFVYTGFNKGKYVHLWKFSKFNLKKVKFLELDFYIPVDPEKYLEEIYGEDWKIPNKNFDSILSGYNVVDKFSKLVRSKVYNKIFSLLCKGEIDKVLYYIEEIEKFNKNDEVLALCKKYLF